MELSFVYPSLLIAMGLALPIILLLKIKFERTQIYKYPLANFLKLNLQQRGVWQKWVLFALKAMMFLLGALIIARPQWRESLKNVRIEGIDIVMAIDVSQSMLCFDDLHDRRSRIVVAKQQALDFVNNRLDDQIGITIFGKHALTLAPLTIDKMMLENVISSLEIGDIDDTATNLAEGLALAVARLNNSQAKSKVVILLTDGRPNNQGHVTMEKAIQLAKDLDVKVYTIGIGSEHGGYFESHFGIMQAGGDGGADFVLLEKIAQSTGGKCFSASNPREIAQAYQQIDQLEKKDSQINQYYNCSDIFWPLMLSLLGILLLHNFLQAFIWRGLW
jgi:Ca-activated chloride channel family protein